MVKGASYASMLRLPVMFMAESNSSTKGKSKTLVGDKGCQVTNGDGSLCRVGV